MKNLNLRKINREELKTIKGAGSGMKCCQVSCEDPIVCTYWTDARTCPILPYCS